jgi:2-polyprenyl-3-methyl-5-hydroxy-6-metoxy-1,4-benzoquinol methylase
MRNDEVRKSAVLTPGRDYYSNVRHEMEPYLPPDYTRVLEIGCGEGVFAPLLKPGCETWGVELDEASAASARTRFGQVLVGTFEAVRDRLPRRHFDLVVCNDVMEHMPYPDDFLVALHEHMVSGGYIIASIPNMRHWEVLWQLLVRKDWRYGREGIMDRTHLRFFTERSILRMFEEAGFRIERSGGINGVFDPFRRATFRTLSLVTLGLLSDIQFRQFAVLARLP